MFKVYDDSKTIIALAHALTSCEAAQYDKRLRHDLAVAEAMGLEDVARFCQARVTMFRNAECLVIITQEERDFVDNFIVNRMREQYED